KLIGVAPCRNSPEVFTVKKLQRAIFDFAQPMRFFQNRVEYRREVTGRGVDHPENLGGRGLLFQRLARLGNQMRVLHRYLGLSGKISEQSYLFFTKWTNFASVNG